ncbi:hypothetical protein HGD85_01130 [Rhodobacteraceae bacterium R_SAG10]|nr:hypothetical protein [Rhodobacteraceae bacterium R_SAG10]
MPFEVTHAPLLILGSLVVAIMGAFTALRLTSNLRHVSTEIRKTRVTQGAIALGTSIWSMHFIAMLAIKLPVAISYDPLRTLASALLAVLVVGLAFLSLHFGVRTKKTIFIAGILTGFGIAGMHYLGMNAISENVIVTYNTFGVVLAICIGIAASIAALELAYGDRSLLSISIGSVMLGLAISAMHHTAMYFTRFYESQVYTGTPVSVLDNEILALIVMMSSFVLSGLFLLLAVPTGQPDADASDEEPADSMADDAAGPEPSPRASMALAESGVDKIRSVKIPYQQNNVVKFLSAHSIHAVQADGHYTCIYNGVDKLFCPWSISHMAQNLDPKEFIRTHRSFLVNKNRIVGIKRSGDKSFCVVGPGKGIDIPIARPQVNELKKLLQMG